MENQDAYLLIEPFNTGSHKQLIDILLKKIPGTHAVTLPGKKWHWKARTSALYLSQVIPHSSSYRSMFASSVLNLAELVALRPDLAPLHKVLYFHENQLVYPVRKAEERDFQFGYNQILSCLVADTVLFNSEFNKESFLTSIGTFLKLIPYERPRNIAEQLRPKCHVLHFPIEFPQRPEQEHKDTFSKSVNDIWEQSECHKASADQGDEVHKADMVKIDREVQGIDKPVKTVLYQSSVGVTTEVQDTNKTEHEFVNEIDSCDMDIDRENQGQLKTMRDPETLSEAVTSSVKDYPGQYADNSDCREDCTSVAEKIRPGATRKRVKYSRETNRDTSAPLHIVWPHRWEHDKGPEAFFQVLFRLQERGLGFQVSVLGEDFLENPAIFEEARTKLQGSIAHWGFLPSKQDYYRVLSQADCVVSTANHEFFGVAMLEAVHLGCYPLCPNRLVYPEIFPKEYLYNTDNQLFKKLQEFCRRPHLVRQHSCKVVTKQYEWDSLKNQYFKYITELQ